MRFRKLQKYLFFPLFMFWGCYAHQGKQPDRNLVYDANAACLRNDPAAAEALLRMKVRETKRDRDSQIARESLQASSICVALQTLSAAK